MKLFILGLGIILMLVGVSLLVSLKLNTGRVPLAPAGYQRAEEELSKVFEQDLASVAPAEGHQDKDVKSTPSLGNKEEIAKEPTPIPQEDVNQQVTDLINRFYEAYRSQQRFEILEELMTPPKNEKEQELFLLLSEGGEQRKDSLEGPLFASEETSFTPSSWQIKELLKEEKESLELLIEEEKSDSSPIVQRDRRLILIKTAEGSYKIEAYLLPRELSQYPKYSGFFEDSLLN